MLNLSPWFYRNILDLKEVISKVEFYNVSTINGASLVESACTLNSNLKPSWVSISEIYSNRDGSGTSIYKNISIYKAISESLERWAFYEAADSREREFCFHLNPSTTGMAAYPSFNASNARRLARLEAVERWALHEFWRGNLPVIKNNCSIPNLNHFQIVTPFKGIYVSLLSYYSGKGYLYSFAANINSRISFNHALVELARNNRVMNQFEKSPKMISDFLDISDRRIYFFYTPEGYNLFHQKILCAPHDIKSVPKLICDKEILGQWSEYTRVWRYLFADSFPDSETDHTFFMF